MSAPGGRNVRSAAAPGPVPAGAGWPGDPATAATPVATGRDSVRALSAGAGSLAELTARQSVCRACPRLVAWREQVAVTRRRAFAAEPYWGRPVPGWGDENPGIVIVGLGHFAWQAAWRELARMGHQVPVPRPAFGHGVEVRLAGLVVIGCYHPSQQNTFTGRVTGAMLDAVFERARSVAGAA